jgi:hypothetical protein
VNDGQQLPFTSPDIADDMYDDKVLITFDDLQVQVHWTEQGGDGGGLS